MGDVRENLAKILCRAAQRLRGTELPVELAERMEGLAKRVHEPCVVAPGSEVLRFYQVMQVGSSSIGITDARTLLG